MRSTRWKLVNTIAGEGYHGLRPRSDLADAGGPRPKSTARSGSTGSRSSSPTRPRATRRCCSSAAAATTTRRRAAANPRSVELRDRDQHGRRRAGDGAEPAARFSPTRRTRRRSEDDLIAYTRVKQIATKDDTWLVRLAMVKSGVRAHGCDAGVSRERGRRQAQGRRFVVSGGSKRGWTTWLVGAVDRRVVAIMPTVIDALNSEAITRHHFEAMGFFSSALNDYVTTGCSRTRSARPSTAPSWRSRTRTTIATASGCKIPKYLVNASGDQFFLPDNSQFYFDDLEGEKYLRYVPNARHNLGGQRRAREPAGVLSGGPRQPAAAQVLVDEGDRTARCA